MSYRVFKRAKTHPIEKSLTRMPCKIGFSVASKSATTKSSLPAIELLENVLFHEMLSRRPKRRLRKKKRRLLTRLGK